MHMLRRREHMALCEPAAGHHAASRNTRRSERLTWRLLAGLGRLRRLRSVHPVRSLRLPAGRRLLEGRWDDWGRVGRVRVGLGVGLRARAVLKTGLCAQGLRIDGTHGDMHVDGSCQLGIRCWKGAAMTGATQGAFVWGWAPAWAHTLLQEEDPACKLSGGDDAPDNMHVDGSCWKATGRAGRMCVGLDRGPQAWA